MTQPSRIAEEVDSEEVTALLERFQGEYAESTAGPEGITAGAEVPVARVREHVTRGLSVFLLSGSPRVGVAQLQFREYLLTGSPICCVEALYVVPERRRQGYGRELMESAFHVARRRGATIVELATTVGDTAARALYESLEFSNFERPGRSDTQMLYYQRTL